MTCCNPQRQLVCPVTLSPALWLCLRVRHTACALEQAAVLKSWTPSRTPSMVCAAPASSLRCTRLLGSCLTTCTAMCACWARQKGRLLHPRPSLSYCQGCWAPWKSTLLLLLHFLSNLLHKSNPDLYGDHCSTHTILHAEQSCEV